MELADKQLKCTDCQVEFVFSSGEQEFFRTRNLINVPKRCPSCRLAVRFARCGRDVEQLSDVECADCAKPTKVPFKPKGYRPIYCNDCLAQRKSSSFQLNIEVVGANMLVGAGCS